MGSKFIEKHKRKSVLAALLLIFQGRAKYVAILLVVTVLSIPFMMSEEALGRLVTFAPVASALRALGMGGVVSAVNPKYSNDLLKAALDKAAADSKQDSFWQKFLNSVNATLPPGGGPSSLAMVTGGGADLYGPPRVKDAKGEKAKGPGQVKGAVNEEERGRGDTGDGVDLQGLLAGGGAADGMSGLYDSMGQNLAASFSGGSGMNAGPYMNRTMFASRNGADSGGGAAIYDKAMKHSSVGDVPLPTAVGKVRSKRMGRVSGFAWKNVGYNRGQSGALTKIGSKRPMFQLAETFTMTGAAMKQKDTAYEYQAAYTGSTYDGNDTGADVMETDADAPTVPPDTGFTDGLMQGAQDMQDQAKQCSDANGTNGAKMSEDADQMQKIKDTMGSPPKCCSSGVGAWNDKVNRMTSLCQDYNANDAILAGKCQTSPKPQNCGAYSKMHINPCSKWKCWLAILLMILLGGLFGLAGMIAVAAVIGGSMMGLFGDKMNSFVESVTSFIASGGDSGQGG